LQFEISYGRESCGKRKSFCESSTWQIYSRDSNVENINDNCILGVDFLKKIHLENIFKTFSTNFKIFSKQKEIQCGHLKSFLEVPSNLKYLFEESSKNLNESQKLCAEFINEFHDVFSEETIAGNCRIGEHVNLQDSSLQTGATTNSNTYERGN